MPQHVRLKSLSGVSLFHENLDYKTFQLMLKELHCKYKVDIHAYVLLPQYIEFLATPAEADALPKFMQSLGRKYVGYFNKKYNRRGTLFEGRYKASLLEENLYLFEVMRYIESSVSHNWSYSSIGRNLYAKSDPVVTVHRLYKQLGFRDDERIKAYAGLFYKKVDNNIDDFIANALEKQQVTGSTGFVKNLEKALGAKLASGNRGRPKKQKKGKKMYKNLVVLEKKKHGDLKISPTKDLFFAKETPFIPLLAYEAEKVGAAFPVVFSLGEKVSSLVALVSLGGDSLAINEEGKWIAPYLPEYLKKYPFSLASTKESPEQGVILIDEASPLFSKTEGNPLFTESGEQSETLANTITFLTDYENKSLLSKEIAKVITDSGILDDREISVGEGEEKKVLVKGFGVVNRERLNALSDDVLAEWTRKGIITLIDAHIKSINNIQTLINLAQQKQK